MRENRPHLDEDEDSETEFTCTESLMCGLTTIFSSGKNKVYLLRSAADLCLYCYEKDFMDSLNHESKADVIEAFKNLGVTMYSCSIILKK